MKREPFITNSYYSPFLYFVGKQFTRLSFDWIWRRKIVGLEHIPPAGTPTIFAANHRSYGDPNLVGTAVPYPIHYFAKEELFKVPILGWYLLRVNAFPVRRKAQDKASIENSQQILRNGGGLLIFPEGGRRLRKELQWIAKPGVGMLACTTGAIVVPVHIENSDHLLQFPKLKVTFGKPIKPPKKVDRQTYETFSQQIMDAVRHLGEKGKK